MNSVLGDVGNGQIHSNYEDRPNEHKHVDNLNSVAQLSSTLYEMVQYPWLSKVVHVKSDKEGDGYFYKWDEIYLIVKQQPT